MSRNQKIITLFGITFLLLGSLLAKEYIGTVTEFVSNDNKITYMKFGMDGMKGNITWVISPGTYVRGPIYNSEGKIIREGELLATVDDRFYRYDVKSAEAALFTAKGALKDAKTDFERQTSLFAKKAVPSIERDRAEAAFYSARGAYEDARARVEYSKFVLSQCSLRASFDGYVQEVFIRKGGWSNIDYPVLKLIKLNPLYVDLKVSREVGRDIISGKKKISIIPNTTNKPVGAYNIETIFSEDGIRLPVSNYILRRSSNEAPIIYHITIAGRFNQDSSESKPLSVPITSLFKDNKGYFVWQAVGQKGMQPNRSISPKFKIKKVYVKPGEQMRYGTFIEKVIILQDSGTLNEYDILIDNPHFDKINQKSVESLKEGMEVEYSKIQTLFWPGDKVKVIVE